MQAMLRTLRCYGKPRPDGHESGRGDIMNCIAPFSCQLPPPPEPDMNVVVLGASNRPEKYAHMAFQMLREHGHTVLPVNPILKEIEGVQVYPSIKDVTEP